MPASLRCTWEVSAGMIPGQSDPELFRSYDVTNVEWEDKHGGMTSEHPFNLKRIAAQEYAADLTALCANGRTCNWVRVDFVWL